MAWAFDETSGQYVLVSDNAALTFPDGDWSFGGWIKLDDNLGASFQYFISWGAFGADPSFNWLFGEATTAIPNKLRLLVNDSSGNSFGPAGIGITSSGSPGTNSSWMYLIAIRSGSTLTQYINGVVDGSEINASVNAVDVTASLYMGMRSDGDPNRRFGGSMAEWAKWDRALSLGEIVGLSIGWTPQAVPTPVWHLNMFDGLYAENQVPLTVTNQGSTSSDHPGGLIYPSPALVMPAAAAPPSGLSIPIAMHHYQHNLAG